MYNPIKNSIAVLLVALLLVPLFAGCSNSKLRRTPESERPTPWFCEINEARDDWDCVQDAALAKNPKPKRLPSDPVEANPFDVNEPLTRTDTTGMDNSANPSAAIDFDLASAAIERGREISVFLTLPREHFTVQLTTTETRAIANRFVKDHGLADRDEVLVLELVEEGTFYYVVLLGTYEQQEAAQAAVDSRPEELADLTPWIRTLEPIQAGVRNAEALRNVITP